MLALTTPVIIADCCVGLSASSVPKTLPVGKAGWNFEQILPIAPAYAEGATTNLHTAEVAQRDNPFVTGLKEFWGAGPGSQRYRVVVASITDYDAAKATAEKLNSMKILPAPASVGDRKLGNPYFPVVIDGWLTYPAAKELRDKVSTLKIVHFSSTLRFIARLLNLLRRHSVEFQGSKTRQKERGREPPPLELVRDAGLGLLEAVLSSLHAIRAPLSAALDNR